MDESDGNCSSGLCDLPDEVLIHILSFLKLSDAAKMSLVLKRCKSLWAFIPNLDLQDWCFRPHNKTLFWGLVERIFSLRGDTPIAEFSLICGFHEDPSLIANCVRTVLRYRAQKLRLILGHDQIPYELALALKSEILEVLELGSALRSICLLTPASSICLPKLKVLQLSNVTFVDHDTVANLFSGPSLESLSISHCQWRKITTIHISAPNLQSIYIDEVLENWVFDLDDLTFEDAFFERQVHINGASLKSFSITGDLFKEYHILGDTTQLVERGEINIVHPIIVPRDWNKLLSSIANVKELILSHQILMDLGRRNVHLDTPFSNVTLLRLEGNIDYMSFVGLSKILTRSPHLTSLAFSKCFGSFPQDEMAGLLDPVPLCFQTELKEITLGDFGGEFRYVKEHIFMVGLLLETATALEKMKISFIDDHMDTEFLDKHIGSLLKGSENCRVSFVRSGA